MTRSRKEAAKANTVASVPGNLRRVTLILTAIWAVLFAPQIFGARAFVNGDT